VEEKISARDVWFQDKRTRKMLRASRDLSATDLLVGLVLVDLTPPQSDEPGGFPVTPIEDLAFACRLSYSAVQRALKKLEELGFIAQESKQGAGFRGRWLVGTSTPNARVRGLSPATDSDAAQEETSRAFTLLQRAFRVAKIHKLRLDNIAPEWPRQPAQRRLGAWLLAEAATHRAPLEQLAELAATGYLADDGENLIRTKWPLEWMAQPACLAKLGAHLGRKLRSSSRLPPSSPVPIASCGEACSGCALCRSRVGGAR
jgi:DNA-binding MarR family transcriptional regulator